MLFIMKIDNNCKWFSKENAKNIKERNRIGIKNKKGVRK